MYTRILVAIDSSDTAQKALAAAIQIAAAVKARLCAMHAIDEGPLSQHALGLGTYIDAEKVKTEMRADAQRLLAAAAAAAQAAGVAAESRTVESAKQSVAEQIAAAAEDWRADLIVVGTHGRRGVDRLLVGSVAENLTRIAKVSLLTVR